MKRTLFIALVVAQLCLSPAPVQAAADEGTPVEESQSYLNRNFIYAVNDYLAIKLYEKVPTDDVYIPIESYGKEGADEKAEELLEQIKHLVERGANIDVLESEVYGEQSSDGEETTAQSIYSRAISNIRLFKNCSELFIYLISQGADITNFTTRYGSFLVNFLQTSPEMDHVKTLLTHPDIRKIINETDRNGETALHYMIRMLTYYHAPMNYKRIYNTGLPYPELPTHAQRLAAKQRSREIISMLIDAGADPRVQDRNGRTALKLLVRSFVGTDNELNLSIEDMKLLNKIVTFSDDQKQKDELIGDITNRNKGILPERHMHEPTPLDRVMYMVIFDNRQEEMKEIAFCILYFHSTLGENSIFDWLENLEYRRNDDRAYLRDHGNYAAIVQRFENLIQNGHSVANRILEEAERGEGGEGGSE